ncbi:MAG: PEP-utilizing enzyme, partial [Patescibacteria group bacterium]
ENSLYLDLLDPVEEMAIEHIFGARAKQLQKKDINLLLSPNDPSNLQKEQDDMLEIFELAKAKGRDNQEVALRLQKHSTDYHWIKNDYEKVSYLDTSYFRGVLDTWLAYPVLAEGARNVAVNMEELGKSKAALIKSLDLDDKTLSQLDIMNLFTNLRDDRKKYNCISSYYLDRVAESVARVAGCEHRIALWTNVYELPRLLDEPSLVAELEKRDQYGCLSYTDGEKLPFETGEHVREIYNQFEKGLQKSEIRGNSANPGKAIGIAKIILNQGDFDKMEKDDVLVAAMTRPEYVPIMKLASAIITDEGGITCHAAIVARELRIPCIIGTQVATKMLKDGDKVEVNANHGTVIKL